jgi:YfiH family protein
MPTYHQSPDISTTAIRHGFFTRQDGVSHDIFASLNCCLSSADDPTAVQENRRRVAAEFGLTPERLLSCYQIHSPDVVIVTELWNAAERPRADAMVTREKNIALGILTADCVPVLFADAKAGVIGAAHAGWRGALGGVLDNTVKAMEAQGAKRSQITAALGPCIWQKSYEVGSEFPAPFLAENPEQQKFFRPAFKADHYQFDLPGYVVNKLKGLGLNSVAPSIADTLPDEANWFSYRRNTLRGITRGGSLISVIMLT